MNKPIITESKPSNPLVAIRCITYNHELYIRDALEGFVMQKTNFPFVAIVHDDASTDGTAAIIREYAEKYPDIIKPIYETENQYSKGYGLFDRIIDAACDDTGAKYIARCEGDDYWTDPFKLQKQVDLLELNPDYGMCYTNAKSYVQKTNSFNDIAGGNCESFDCILKSNHITTLSVLYRRNLYNEYWKEIKPYTRNWFIGDLPLWLYIAKNSKIKFIDETTGVYRVLSESASHSNIYGKMLRIVLCATEIIQFFENYAGYSTSLTDIRVSGLRLELAIDKNNPNEIRTHRKQLRKILNLKIGLQIGASQFLKNILLILMPRLTYKILKFKYTRLG